MSKPAVLGAVQPQNLEAEESVLSALLLAGVDGHAFASKTLAKVRDTRLEPSDFYRASNGTIYEAIFALVETGGTCDVIAVAERLGAEVLEGLGGKLRLGELAATATATSNIAHHARIVRETAERRRLWRELQPLLTNCENGWLDAAEGRAALKRAADLLDSNTAANSRFQGISFADACKAEIPQVRELVEGIIDAGTVGLIAGLPFSRKSFLAQALAHTVAAGSGELLGRYPILAGGPVIYVWQDDSTAKELERIQLYASRHDYPETLPLRFLINEGIRIPDDLPSLRSLVQADGAVLVILDSLYNVLSPELALKDESVALVLAAVKQEICDATGATVAVVDHAPWPTEGNKGQKRAYGSVFKSAAVRWAIHLEADWKDATTLHVEAKGNNVAGFRRCTAIWDEETLEIRLLDEKKVSTEAEVRDLLTLAGPDGLTMSELKAATEKSERTLREVLKKKLGAIKQDRPGSTGEPPWNLPEEEDAPPLWSHDE
jgi:hypothetical protein